MSKVCLQIHNDYLLAGGETKSAKLIGDSLEKEGYKVIRYYKDNKEIIRDRKSKVLIGINSIYNRETVNDIETILSENKVDFALIHNTAPIISNSIYDVLKKNNIPIIKYVQNYNLLCLNGAQNKNKICDKCKNNNLYGVKEKCYKDSIVYSLAKYIIKRSMDNKYIDKIDGFICISKYVEDKHRQLINEKQKLTNIYHFIDNSVEVRNIYNNSIINKEYFTYMGRISEEKGVLTLIKTMKLLPHIHLKILGTGEIEKKLREYVLTNNMNNVEFIGFCEGEKKKNILSNTKALIVPSEWDEPFGRIVIESYQVGTPVIVSNRGGLTELVKYSKTGFVFKCGDVLSLKQAILDIYNMNYIKYNSMRESCIEYVLKEFCEEKYIIKFNNFLKDILK